MKRLFFPLFACLAGVPVFASASISAPTLRDTSWHLGWLTNSIFTSWVVTILALIGFRVLLGQVKTVPGRFQGVVETVVDGLKGVYEPIVGKKAMPLAFPVLITLFFFILVHNWSGLIPGVGTIGWGEPTGKSYMGLADVRLEHGTPLLRPHTADFNGTLALALFSFGAWFILVLKYAGAKFLLKDVFGNKAERDGMAAPVYYGLSVLFLVIGLIETFSILIRPFTLSVRLFGNIFGGESLMHAVNFAFPFYFLEVLVGVVQALVFTLLTAVYIGLICNHGDDHAEAHH